MIVNSGTDTVTDDYFEELNAKYPSRHSERYGWLGEK